MNETEHVDIKLISEITVRLIQSCGGDHMVVAAARISTCGEDALKYTDPACAEENSGLINYLMKSRHGSAFEHSGLTFFVHAPIFVWREWHRHRVGFSYNEESARFHQLEPVFYFPDRERPMMKVDGWKPGRPKFTRCEEDVKYHALVGRLTHSYEVAYATYQRNIDAGFDPGLARDCLPVGIYSSCWVTCNPRSLMNFLSLRVHEPDATFPSYPLWEIDMAARVCEQIFDAGWPITHQAFVKNGRVAP